jgi:hypothetical protein
MTKARNIANLASDGSALADGTINYTDVSGTPTLATVATSGAYADVTGTPTLATVATTGAYADVTGTPAAALPLTGGNLSGGLTVTGTVAATAVTGDGSALTGIVSIPSGLISMWHGLVANIPSGWALCDGTAGTPNLVGQFIKGGSIAGTTGGSNTHTHTNTLSAAAHTLTTAQMPSHGHTFDTWQSTFNTANSGAGVGVTNYRNLRSVSSTGGGGSHSHTMSGSIDTASTEPAYYTLCFIMKT